MSFLKTLKPHIKAALIRTLEATSQRTGLARAYALMLQREGATILGYHSVPGPSTASWVDPRWQVSPAEFEWQMRFLARRRRVISLRALLEDMQAGRSIPAGTVVLTFDDGYLDNLQVVAPILEQYKLPATLFLATDFIDRPINMFIDQLHAAFRARQKHQLNVFGERFNLEDPTHRRQAFQTIDKTMISTDVEERSQLIADVQEQLGALQDAPRLTMNWSEVQDLQRNFPTFEIGTHTHHHISLTAVNDERIEQEIAISADRLAEHASHRPAFFSYPYARVSASAQACLKEQGVIGAVGGSNVLITATSDPLALQRVDPKVSRNAFRFRTSGAFPGLQHACRIPA
jgi:peptidoglycan/xylan/chitin deacetylase (PgdA/CDA1 family)